MPDLDLVIRSGTVVTASDRFDCDIGVREGRIVALAEDLPRAAREIDARGKLVLPGGVDSHCHHRAALGHGHLERRRLLQRHGLGGVRRHDHGDPVRRPAPRPVDARGGRRLPRAREQGRDRPRLPHDRLGPVPAVMAELPGADPGGLLLAQAVHDLSSAAARRRPDARPPGARARRGRHGLGPRRERRHARLDRAPPARARPYRAPLPCGEPSPDRRGRGGLAADRDGRAGRPAGRRLPRHDRGLDGGDPGRPDPRPEGVRRDLPAISAADRSRPRQTRSRGRQMDVQPAGARADADQEAIWRGVRNGTFQIVTSDHAPYRFDKTGKLAAGQTRTSSRSRTASPASSCVCRCSFPKEWAKTGSS